MWWMCVLLVGLPLSSQDLVTLTPSGTGSKTGDSSIPGGILKPSIRSMHVTSHIVNRYATTVVSSRVVNPSNQSGEAAFTLTLPESAFISEFLMDVNGKVYKATVMEKGAAQAAYKDSAQAGLSAAHVALEARDSMLFGVSVNIEAGGTVTFNLTYEQLLLREQGAFSIVININPQQIVEDMSVTVDIEEPSTIMNLEFPEVPASNETIKEERKRDDSVCTPAREAMQWRSRLLWARRLAAQNRPYPESFLPGGAYPSPFGVLPIAYPAAPTVPKSGFSTWSAVEVFAMPWLRALTECHRLNGSSSEQWRYDLGPVRVEEKSANHKVVVWTPTPKVQKSLNSSGVSGQFVVRYDVDRSENHQQIVVDDDHFVHFFAPKDLPRLSKHVVFVLDYSGSMEGSKLDQLKGAMKNILSDLDSKDYFSIVIFQSIVEVWTPSGGGHSVGREAVVSVSTTNTDLALTYLNSYSDLGGTNIMGGLRTGMELVNIGSTMWTNKKDSPKPVMVFLTDGQPNTEESDSDVIVTKTTALNSVRCPIFSLAFGYGADIHFVRKLSLSNSGTADIIYEAADGAEQLAMFYKSISSPVMSNITFNYAPGMVNSSSHTKTEFPMFFNGSELVVTGMVDKSKVCAHAGQENATIGDLTAVTTNGLQTYPMVVSCPKKSAENSGKESHLKKTWAYVKIQQLLDKADSLNEGTEKKEATAKALTLALQYSFVTPLTSMVVVKPNEANSSVEVTNIKPGPDNKHMGISSSLTSNYTIVQPMSASGGTSNVFNKHASSPVSSKASNFEPQRFTSSQLFDKADSLDEDVEKSHTLPLALQYLFGDPLTSLLDEKRKGINFSVDTAKVKPGLDEYMGLTPLLTGAPGSDDSYYSDVLPIAAIRRSSGGVFYQQPMPQPPAPSPININLSIAPLIKNVQNSGSHNVNDPPKATIARPSVVFLQRSVPQPSAPGVPVNNNLGIKPLTASVSVSGTYNTNVRPIEGSSGVFYSQAVPESPTPNIMSLVNNNLGTKPLTASVSVSGSYDSNVRPIERSTGVLYYQTVPQSPTPNIMSRVNNNLGIKPLTASVSVSGSYNSNVRPIEGSSGVFYQPSMPQPSAAHIISPVNNNLGIKPLTASVSVSGSYNSNVRPIVGVFYQPSVPQPSAPGLLSPVNNNLRVKPLTASVSVSESTNSNVRPIEGTSGVFYQPLGPTLVSSSLLSPVNNNLGIKPLTASVSVSGTYNSNVRPIEGSTGVFYQPSVPQPSVPGSLRRVVRRVPLSDIKWLQPVLAASFGLDNIIVRLGSGWDAVLALNASDESFGPCMVNGEIGQGFHLKFCALDVFQDDFSLFMPYKWLFPGSFLGVCCPYSVL